jgi:hypothetical protein
MGFIQCSVNRHPFLSRIFFEGMTDLRNCGGGTKQSRLRNGEQQGCSEETVLWNWWGVTDGADFCRLVGIDRLLHRGRIDVGDGLRIAEFGWPDTHAVICLCYLGKLQMK